MVEARLGMSIALCAQLKVRTYKSKTWEAMVRAGLWDMQKSGGEKKKAY